MLLFEAWMPGGKATPRHVHPEADETFYVIGGEVLVHIGGNESKASTESTVVITRGVAHAFADTSGSMRVLVVFTPASPVSEAFFRAAGERATAAVLPLPAPPDIPWMTAAARKSGLQVLGPPPFAGLMGRAGH